MSRKAAAGAGTIRKIFRERAGKSYTYWEARVTVGRDPGTGRQIQKSIYGKTQAEVRKKIQEAALAIDQGTYQEPSALTVKDWMTTWIKDYLGHVKPYTVMSYKTQTMTHIIPALGAVRLQALSAPQIQAFYNSLTLSPKTVKNIHGILHEALQQAVELGYIRFNPSDACKTPRAVKREMRPFDEREISAFLEAAKGHRFEDLYIFTLFTGLREGEVLGLKWDRVDFKRGTVLIDQQLQRDNRTSGAFLFSSLKNGKSRLLTPAPLVMRLLRNHRAKQTEHRLIAGSSWEDSGLVFTDELGRHLNARTVYANFKKLAASIGRPDARFHDLRHSYAVAAIRAGDDIKTVQSNLGHATAAFTLDVYGHVTDQMKEASAARMDAFIRSLSGW